MKALIVSVGTGTSSTEEAVESLADAIALSLRHHNPDKAFFLVSEKSEKTTLPMILEKTQIKNYEVITARNPDNIEQVYRDLQPKFKQIRREYSQVAVDYTSGTKAMTSALTILGTTYEANTLNYIAGQRKGGIVQPGTEEIRVIQPYFATAEQKKKTAIQFFNRNQYTAAIAIVSQIADTTRDPQIIDHITPLKNLAEAYELWDKFQHRKAFQILEKIDKKETAKNKQFLGQLLRAENPEPYYIADLLNNAQRRGTEEKR